MLRLYTTIFIFLFSGCSYFTFSMAMCEQLAQDPNAVMPQECRNYNEDEANKAFFKTKPTTDIQEDDIIFKNDEE